MTEHKNNSALVVFSGGQDSTTCLAWSKRQFSTVHALTFDYGQKHSIELDSAKEIAKLTDTPLIIHEIETFKKFQNNALLSHQMEITEGDSETPPSTFVPGRNHFFLSIAALYAQDLGIHDIVTGVCQTDFSGYPDCRQDFITSLEKTLSLAMEYDFKIHTPLMHLTKAESINLMKDLGHLELLKFTHTCYNGQRPACGLCPACKLRLKGFSEAGLKDPITYNYE